MKMDQVNTFFCILLAIAFQVPVLEAETVKRVAKSTITPIELDVGDEFHFVLRNGETRILKLTDSGAAILLTNVYPGEIQQERPDHGVLYQIWIDVNIDGQPMRLSRYLCSQLSFNEPYYVNGMRIWFEYNRAPLAFMTGNRGGVPEKEARIIVNDMTDRIAPDRFAAWYRVNPHVEAREFFNERIDARNNYKGDDMHMGGYFGATPHNGLDINMPRGTQMMAPIDFDDHFIFSNANRWRGIRKWDNGSEWWLQSHHLFRMLVPEYAPLTRGTVYAEGAGTATGEAAHSHFVLRILEEGASYSVDAWMVFWQTFRDRQDARGDIRAAMAPVSPAVTGETISFSSAGSRSGTGDDLRYSWSFGDGGASVEPDPDHAFASPGIYAVRLTIDDGERVAQVIQNITISGEPVTRSVAALSAPDAIEFMRWPPDATLEYGRDPGFMVNTLRFTARATRPVPDVQNIQIVNDGEGQLNKAVVNVNYIDGSGWCEIRNDEVGDTQNLRVSVNASDMPPGVYLAEVHVDVEGALNGKQQFLVQMEIPADPPAVGTVILRNSDSSFFATPWFWAPHSFTVNHDASIPVNYGRWDRPMLPPALLTSEGKNRMGLSDRYLTNGYRKDSRQFFRFTPDLSAGTYQVATSVETPWDQTSEMKVRVRHAGGDTLLRYRPGDDPVIGTFAFAEGRDGFVEFYAGDSIGQVTADTLVFASTQNEFSGNPQVLEHGNGLLAHWTFDDSGKGMGADALGGHPLHFKGRKDAAACIPGIVGDGALSLDGVDDAATAGVLGLDPLQSRTITGWVRLEDIEQPEGAVLFGFQGGAGDSSLMLSIPRFGNRIVVDFGHFEWTLQSERDTEWHHMAVVWDGENMVGYLDGQQAIKATNRFGKETADNFVVGGDDPVFKGALDDIRVYDRALNIDEIRKIFTASGKNN